MPVNNQVVIDIKAQFQNLGKADMVSALKDLQSGLENLKTTNQQGTQAWDDQKSKILGAQQAISGYGRELRGLEPNVQRTSDSLLNMGKNLTVLVAGIEASIGQVIEFGKKIGEMALKGAEITEMRNYFNEMNGGLTLATEKFEGLKQASNFKLSDEDILRFTNRMDDLGYSTTETTQLMDLSERKSDELGISINESALKFTQFIETGRGRGLYKIGVDVGAVNDKIKEMTGLTSAQLKEMDATDQQTIRKNAVLALYGKSLDEINSKQRTTESVLISVGVAFDNAKIKIGEFIAGTIGKLAQAFGLTSEKMASMIVVSGLVVGAIMAISAAVLGLGIALQVASAGLITTVGIIAGLIVALGVWAGIKISSGVSGSTEEYAKLAIETKNLKTELSGLKDSFDVLNQTLPANKVETEKLSQTKSELIKKYPELISNITAEDSALDINKDKLQQLIKVKEDLLNLKIQELNLKAEVTISENYEKYTKAVEDTVIAEQNLINIKESKSKITQQITELEKLEGEELIKKQKNIDDLKTRYGLLNEEELKEFKTIQEGRATILQVNDAYKTLIQSNINAGQSIGQISVAFQNAGGTAKDFGTLLASVGMEALKGVNIAKEHQVEYAQWYMNYVLFLKEAQDTIMNFGTGEYGDKVANSMAIEMQRQLAQLENWKAPTNKGGNNTAKNTKGKETTEETKLTEEEQILKLLQDQIAAEKEKGTLTIAFLNSQKDKYKDIYDLVRKSYLDDPSNPDKAKAFESMKKAMQLLNKETEELFKQTLESIKNTVNPSFEQISNAQDELIKQLANTTDLETRNAFIKLIQEYDKLAEELGKDDVARHQKFMKDREAAQKDITKNMYDWENNLIEDKYDKERKLIKDKYTFEQNELDKQLKAGTIEKWQYDKASGLLKKNKEKDTPTWINEFSDKMNGITSNFSSALGKLSIFFGEKGGEFINTLVDGFNRISAIVTIITDMIQAAKAVSSFFSMLIPGGGGAGKAMATGGYISGMGTGTSDSIPAWLSNGEYVINARSTSMYLPLLNAINGGNPYTTIAKYANGGLVNRSNLSSNVRLEVADVKLKGSDLHLSWRRQDKLETGRKG